MDQLNSPLGAIVTKKMEMKMNMEPEDEIRRCRGVDGSWSRK